MNEIKQSEPYWRLELHVTFGSSSDQTNDDNASNSAVIRFALGSQWVQVSNRGNE